MLPFRAAHPARRRTSWLSVLLAGLVTAAAGLAQAQVPAIDGRGDDLVAYALSLSGENCGLSVDDARDDVTIVDPKIVSCAPQQDTDANGVPDYLVNGFDLRRFVFAYDRSAGTLYLLWRTEGRIGDIDGNGNPDHNVCPPISASFNDQTGIGSEERYAVRIQPDGSGAPAIVIAVGGVPGTDQVTVQGATMGAAALAYRAVAGASGRDLELRISELTLPAGFAVHGTAGAAFDGLSDDSSGTQSCLVPVPAMPASWGRVKSAYR